MNTQMVKATLNGKYEMILPKHRADRPEWYAKKGWEQARLESMEHHLRMDLATPEGFGQEIMFYIGAEMGEMTALCQKWGAEVFIFEPNPKAWPSIRAIWEANKLKFPLGIFAGFASDVTAPPENDIFLEKYLKIGKDGWPICAHQEIVEAHGFKELDKESANFAQITIDDCVEMTKQIPTAISLDVEGAEGKVLRGAEKTLRAHHPKIWLSGHPEFLHDNFNGGGGFEYLRELRTWIKEIGYREEILDYDHEVHLFYHQV